MAYNFLYLVNRLCHKLNEVELNATNFSSATGVYQDFMESVNAAISDIYQEELNVWPFARVNTTFNTSIGVNNYNINAAASVVNWNSFYIVKLPATATVSVNGTTATFTQANHPHQTGDTIIVKDSLTTETAFNSQNYTITVVDANTYTTTVPSGTTNPVGTISVYPQYTTQKLDFIDYQAYLDEQYLETDGESILIGEYGKPKIVVRGADNNIILTKVPDRIYTIMYDYYTAPSDLVNYADVPPIPETFKQVIVDGAMYHAYMFRDNMQEAASAQQKFKDGVDKMRRMLITQPEFFRIDRAYSF